MKKIACFLLVTYAFYGSFVFSESVETIKTQPTWTGFYWGSNVGYWWSETDKVSTSGAPNFINGTFESGASNIANAIAQMATNDFSLHPHGFTVGGGAGYNYHYKEHVLFGFDIDFNGLNNSNNNSSTQTTVNLANFDESYSGTIAIKQNINYLGTIRARLGYLYFPNILIYATGGFAYGNVTLNSHWTAQESLGSTVFPTIVSKDNVNKTLPGWIVGAGIEWLFKPKWSAKLEYIYYSLNDLDTSLMLTQTNASISPPVLWGSAKANTTLSISSVAIRMGVNYHF